MTKRIRRNADWLTIALANAIERPELPSATVDGISLVIAGVWTGQRGRTHRRMSKAAGRYSLYVEALSKYTTTFSVRRSRAATGRSVKQTASRQHA